MYEIKKSGRIKEAVRITNDDEVLELTTDFSPDSVMRDYSRISAIIDKCTNITNSEDAYKVFFSAVSDLMVLIFGEEGKNKLFDFYSGDVLDMIEDLGPFISDRIRPKMEEAVNRKKAAYKKVK